MVRVYSVPQSENVVGVAVVDSLQYEYMGWVADREVCFSKNSRMERRTSCCLSGEKFISTFTSTGPVLRESSGFPHERSLEAIALPSAKQMDGFQSALNRT